MDVNKRQDGDVTIGPRFRCESPRIPFGKRRGIA